MLLDHLDDPTPAHPNAVLQQESGRNAALRQSARPTMGDACYWILQEVIEGKWPEQFTAYHALNRVNIEAWVSKSLRRDLKDLRTEAAEAALRFATEDPPEGVGSTLHKEALEFLNRRLMDLKE